MRIVADKNILFVEEAFATLGQVEAVAAAEITPERVRDADVLLVRSTVKVNEALLAGSRVRFVATATIGIDHLDTAYFSRAKIPWAAAPGSNADSVLQWWTAAVLGVIHRRDLRLRDRKIGIVGVGNVGGRVERLCRAFGLTPMLCDPPRARAERKTLSTVDEIIDACDLITFHTPLERGGSDPTFGLLNEARIARIRDGAILVNASRGEIVDGDALADTLASGRITGILDVFPGEPTPSSRLALAAALCTPHIAGHSVDGKLNGTYQIHAAACAVLGIRTPFKTPLPARDATPPLDLGDSDDERIVRTAVAHYYDVFADDAALRQILSGADVARAFRAYRENYPVHRELTGLRLAIPAERTVLRNVFAVLGCHTG